MDRKSDVPPIYAQHNEHENLRTHTENLRVNTLKLNEFSSEYRKTLISINDRIIVISAGTISLFLTLIGVLYGSEKDISEFEYEYILGSMILFLIVIGLLLISKYFLSLYVFSMAHRHYLESKKELHSSEVRLLKIGATFVNSEYRQMTSDQINNQITLTEDHLSEIDAQIGDDMNKEKQNDIIQKTANLLAYALFLIAYIAAIIFLLSIIETIS